MLSFCKKCGTSPILYDKEKNIVICEKCEQEVAVTQITVKSLISQGKIKKPKMQSFMFKCKTCGDTKRAVFSGEDVVGEGCNKKCDLNISNLAKNALKDLLNRSWDDI